MKALSTLLFLRHGWCQITKKSAMTHNKAIFEGVYVVQPKLYSPKFFRWGRWRIPLEREVHARFSRRLRPRPTTCRQQPVTSAQSCKDNSIPVTREHVSHSLRHFLHDYFVEEPSLAGTGAVVSHDTSLEVTKWHSFNDEGVFAAFRELTRQSCS